MQKGKIYSLFILIFILGCDENSDSKIWVQTTGKIVNIEKISDGSFGFELIYEIQPINSVKEERKPVREPVSIHYISIEKEPLATQMLKLKYMRKEPDVYKLVDRIHYKK